MLEGNGAGEEWLSPEEYNIYVQEERKRAGYSYVDPDTKTRRKGSGSSSQQIMAMPNVSLFGDASQLSISAALATSFTLMLSLN